MRPTHFAIAAFVFAIASLIPAAAYADQPISIEIAPVYFLGSTGDATAAPPVGTVPLYCPNPSGLTLTAPVPTITAACTGNPVNTSDLKLDYGLTWRFAKGWDIKYSHDWFDFAIGRVLSLAPGTSVISGDIVDRLDKISLDWAYGHGLGFALHYESHQRDWIAAASNPPGACFFNSEGCPGGVSNPSSINSINYGFDASYSFGPHARFYPAMFKLSASTDYWPRASNGMCGTATPLPACGTGGYPANAQGVPAYVGSGWTFPYSLTMFPLAKTPLWRGFIPLVSYARDYVWFRAENTAEAYNVMNFGFIQALPFPGLSFSYVNTHFNGCYCSDTVPPPDNIRFVDNIFKLTYDLKI